MPVVDRHDAARASAAWLAQERVGLFSARPAPNPVPAGSMPNAGPKATAIASSSPTCTRGRNRPSNHRPRTTKTITELHVSFDLTLPADLITQTAALLSTRRGGKSNAAAMVAEEMYDAVLPWVAIDPKGDWWGLRSSADGTGRACRSQCSAACTATCRSSPKPGS